MYLFGVLNYFYHDNVFKVMTSRSFSLGIRSYESIKGIWVLILEHMHGFEATIYSFVAFDALCSIIF